MANALALRTSVAASELLHPTLGLGALRRFDGVIVARDLSLGMRAILINKPATILSVEPTVTLPTGATGEITGPVPTTTASVDPAVTVNGLFGGSVLLLPALTVRKPLLPGRDGVVDGTYLRSDLNLALRAGDWVPAVGLSALHQQPNALGTQGLSEIAAVVGTSWALSETTGLNGNVRVPLITDATERYGLGFGLGVRQVVALKKAGGAH